MTREELAGAMKPSLASSGKGDVERRLEELAAKPKGTKP